MPMNRMAPKLPSVAAFGLLAELEKFFAQPAKERRAALAEYEAATERRQLMLDAMQADADAAAADRAAATLALELASRDSAAALDEAKTKADGIVAAANEQAKIINKTTADNAVAARDETEAAAQEMQDSKDALKARWAACEEREATAFKEREDAVTLREQEVARKKREAEDMHTLGLATKDGYEALLKQINALVPAAAG